MSSILPYLEMGQFNLLYYSLSKQLMCLLLFCLFVGLVHYLACQASAGQWFTKSNTWKCCNTYKHSVKLIWSSHCMYLFYLSQDYKNAQQLMTYYILGVFLFILNYRCALSLKFITY